MTECKRSAFNPRENLLTDPSNFCVQNPVMQTFKVAAGSEYVLLLYMLSLCDRLT